MTAMTGTARVGRRPWRRSLLLLCVAAAAARADGPRLAGVTRLADRLDLLTEILPGSTPEALASIPAEPVVLGRLPPPAPRAGETALPASLLVAETISRSLVSYTLCADPPPARCGQVRLHFTREGLAAEQGEASAILSRSVGLELRSGWFLGFDAANRSLVAFRSVAPHRYEDADGRTVEVPFRSPPLRDGVPDTSSRNFGRGDGLLASVVLRGDEMARQIGVVAQPIIERLVEIEPGNLLVFFSQGTVRAVHLLQLEEVEEPLAFDLDDAGNPAKLARVRLLRGRGRLVPAAPGAPPSRPFLDFSAIAQRVTGNDNILLAGAEPLRQTPAAFLFDQFSTLAMTVEPVRDDPAGAITGSLVSHAFDPDRLLAALREAEGVALISPPCAFSGGYLFSDGTELCLALEPVPLLLGFDPLRAPAERLRTVLGSDELLLRRTPDGVRRRVPELPSLVFTWAYAQEHGWLFDAANGELLAVSRAAVVVAVADREALLAATGERALGRLYVTDARGDDLLAFDPVSSSLLALHLAPRLPDFVRGDCNGDGRAGGNVADAIVLLEHSFRGGPRPPCAAACDADADGRAFGAVTDAVYVLAFSFLGGPPPLAPFPECGPGNAVDRALGCERAPPGCR